MGYDEMLLAQHQRDEDRAEAAADLDERRADTWAAEFDKLIQARDLDAETGCRFMPKLGDVLTEASTQQDQSIFTSMLQALVHCAAKGQVEATEAIAKVRTFFVTQRLELEQKP